MGLDSAFPTQCLAAVLDELDYGIVLLVGGSTRVAHVNHAAHAELGDEHPLRLGGGTLEARLPADAGAWRDALVGASRQGLRCLLTLGGKGRRVGVSIVPLPAEEGGEGAVLVVLGKSAVCESLTIAGFCRSLGLTWAESRVLVALCAGAAPKDIARQLGVGISTIRTQIQSMREKTGAASIGALVADVATLPPLRGVLRGGPLAASRS